MHVILLTIKKSRTLVHFANLRLVYADLHPNFHLWSRQIGSYR